MNQQIRDHIQYNLSSEDYRTAPLISNTYPPQVNWEKLPESIAATAQANLEIFRQRGEERRKRTVPTVGDWIKQPNGNRARIAHIWGDEPGSMIQTTGCGSFHLFSNGHADMSGSLDTGVRREHLKDTGTFEPAEFWIFSQDRVGGNRGVYHTVPARVWESSINIQQPQKHPAQ